MSQVFVQQLLNGLIIGVGYALIALGLTLVFGILDILNFAHGEFYMLGAFLTWVFSSTFGYSYFVAALLALLSAIALGMLTQVVVIRPLMQRDQTMTLLATFAVSVLFMNLAEIIFGATPQRIITPFSDTLDIGSVTISQQRLIVLIAGVLIVALLTVIIQYTKFGKILRATAQNKNAASLVGIHIGKVHMFGFGLGSGLAAISGILLGPLTTIFPSMGQAAVIKGFVIVVLGGLGSMPGAIIGGVFLGIIEALAAGFISSAWKDLFGYSVLILILLLRPYGLFGAKRSGT